ncbi:hypothetical protein [Hymenobacter psychrotolerans]|uniref:SpoIIAA-like n=1 Tax=Hymenobacter psychrotolerans DSM 18569 TaxID=1121959 RepID=A0A1M7G8E9_9BACT|nr:hypothetical protein [Hymenobacter psychrotolerans]SHM12207.1 hypothetical protein SAMN02746009_03977 [Hymenobacter psychrotolerans DSM 18569]
MSTVLPPSANRLYFENAAGRVEEDVDGYVRLTYHPGRREMAVWQGLLQHTKRLLTRQAGGLMMVDQQQMTAFTPQEQAWLTEQWLPQALVEGGYRFGAVVQARDVFARLAMDSIRLQVQHLQLEYRYFPDEAAARAWLLSRPTSRS